MLSNPRILIVRTCALGDFILNLPALRAIAAQYPDAVFTLVGNPENLSLARKFIPVVSIHSIESPPWNRLYLHPLPDLNFDFAWVWMNDSAVANHLRASGISRVFHHPAFPGSILHAADHLLATVGLPAPPLPDLWRPGSSRVIIHPGSGSKTKCWSGFEELAEAIPEAVMLTGPCEATVSPRLRMLKDLPLQQVSEEIRSCRMFIGNDSGITHLAAYWGCPTVALFGPTDPRVWGPIGRRVKIIWKQPLHSISIEEIRNHL